MLQSIEYWKGRIKVIRWGNNNIEAMTILKTDDADLSGRKFVSERIMINAHSPHAKYPWKRNQTFLDKRKGMRSSLNERLHDAVIYVRRDFSGGTINDSQSASRLGEPTNHVIR